MIWIFLALLVPLVLWAVIVAPEYMPVVRCTTCKRKMVPFHKHGFVVVAGEGPAWACAMCANVYCADHLPERGMCECGQGEARVCNVLYQEPLRTNNTAEPGQGKTCQSCGSPIRPALLRCEQCGTRTSNGRRFIQFQFVSLRRHKNTYILLELYGVAALVMGVRCWYTDERAAAAILVVGASVILVFTRNFWRSYRHLAEELRSNGITPWLQ